MIDHQLKLLIRADAGPHLGSRHVQRMLTLGQAWSRFGEVAFVLGDLPASLADRIDRKKGFQVHQIRSSPGEANDLRETREVADAFEPDWIALDGPRFDNAYQNLLAQQPAQMLVLDESGHGFQDADLVLTQIPSDQPHLHSVRLADPQKLTGPEFALVQAVSPSREETSRHIFSQAKRILVAFSGADLEKHSLRILQLLSEVGPSRLMVDCVIDSDFLHWQVLDEFKRGSDLHLRFHRNSDRLLTLLQRVDLAITDDNSCFQAAHCGVPTIVIKAGENKRLSATTLGETGTMISLADLPGIKLAGACNSTVLLHRLIRRLMSNRTLRSHMSELGRQHVDGLGADRVARKMVARCLSFRVAGQHDAGQLREWQNDPEVRSVSFDSQQFTDSANQGSIHKKISDGKTQLWIVEDRESRPIGQVQIVAEQSGTAIVSLIVDQARRGRGLGTVLVEQAVEKAFQDVLVQRVLAQFRPINIASERAFKNAGFQPIQPTTIAGQLANQFVFERSWLRHAPAIAQDLKKSA